MFYAKPWLDALIVLLVVLLFVGPKRLPALGKSLGHGMREFKDGITGASKADEDEGRPALNEAEAPAAESAAAPASTEPQRESAEVGSSEQRV